LTTEQRKFHSNYIDDDDVGMRKVRAMSPMTSLDQTNNPFSLPPLAMPNRRGIFLLSSSDIFSVTQFTVLFSTVERSPSRLQKFTNLPMLKRPQYPGMLPPWRASKMQKTNESVAARVAKSRRNMKAHRDKENECLQKILEAEAQQRYAPY